MPAGGHLVECIDHGAVRELRLARPPVNALDPQLCAGLSAAIAEAIAEGVQGLVLSGGPKVFSAGLDVPFLVSLGDDRAALRAAWEAFFEAARALAQSPVPVVAALGGHAPAGGCVLALCCDYRVMASGPFAIGLNETQVGLVAPEGIQHLLARVVGQHRAERLLVAGDLVESERALALGLVDELVEIEHVAVRARVWLEQLLALPRQPMLMTRRIARADLVAALAPERIGLQRFVDAWFAPDTQAALRELMAKLGK
ncbi:enoyl-CoA hydratase/isomerase family protein [Luteimonas sp. 50]|uniref:Enoyl-CoA hydratase/isomerase family protein n=1 Tax=Cognatiluteimonas sedimenti TaxID=2927791 RepID=A0ABT0A2B1_9GAMM|nr:enoyl-CoA hydratase/isomerase family protein [Lysobacter sedimenti]MCJ0825123.1 enoyl-CoA hydratase/isomerase family protein [Lysobacter sedimenti]